MKFVTTSVECYSVMCQDCRAAVIVYSADKGHEWMQAHATECGAA